MNQNGSGDCHENVNDKTKLIVNYIPQFTTEEDLAVVFTQVGPVENIRIMRNFRTGYSFGYGFVKYYKEEDAAKAIDVLNGLNYRLVSFVFHFESGSCTKANLRLSLRLCFVFCLETNA